MKLPAIQFYTADWRKDPGVQSLGYFDRGVWFEILCLMNESSERGVLLLNGMPMPDEALGRILGLDNQTLTTTLTTLLSYGVAKRRESDGAIYNKRMVDDENLRKIRKEAGKLGGNPNLVNQKQTTQVKQKPTPSSSSSITSSNTYVRFEEFWKSYPSNRKVGKKPCCQKWKEKNLEAMADLILKDIELKKQTQSWRDGFNPAPLTYLNQERWQDGVETVSNVRKLAI